jgi:hypothetical protein
MISLTDLEPSQLVPRADEAPFPLTPQPAMRVGWDEVAYVPKFHSEEIYPPVSPRS